jgi:hypothetical protein
MTYVSNKGERTIGEPVKVLDVVANKVFSKIRKKTIVNENDSSLKKYIAVIYEIEGEEYQ